jgi:mRNA interferase RelE/StbE
MDVYYTDTAKRQLKKLERHVQERIVDKIRFFVSHSDPLEFAEPLTGYDAYRFRVGDYRVTFELENDTVRVLSIRRKDEAYK